MKTKGAQHSFQVKEASLFTGGGWQQLAGGGEKFWTRPEGGAKNFGRVAKGGRKISDLIYIFQITEIQCFLEFLCVLG